MKTGILFIISLLLLASTGFFGYKYYTSEKKYSAAIKVEQSVNIELVKEIDNEIDICNIRYKRIQDMTPQKLISHFDSCVCVINDHSKSLIELLDSLKKAKYHVDENMIISKYNDYRKSIHTIYFRYDTSKILEKNISEIFTQTHDSLKLSNLIAHAKLIELNALRYILWHVTIEDFKFNTHIAIISSDNPIIKLGDKYTAKIFLGGFDTHSNYDVVIENSPAIRTINGEVQYSEKPLSEGFKTIKGHINIIQPNGDEKIYPFKTQYFVTK